MHITVQENFQYAQHCQRSGNRTTLAKRSFHSKGENYQRNQREVWATKYAEIERKKKTVKWFATTRLKEGPEDKGEKKDRRRR